MLFKPDHVMLIKLGIKTQTRRLWKRPMVKVGGVYKVKTKMLSKKSHCNIRVTDLKIERLGCISEKGCHAEGGYTRSEFIEEWTRINGSWDPSLRVYVVTFEVVD